MVREIVIFRVKNKRSRSVRIPFYDMAPYLKMQDSPTNADVIFVINDSLSIYAYYILTSN